MQTTTTTTQHDFERHGLGQYPYTFRGYEERTHTIPGGALTAPITRAGTTCDRCGAALRHCYWFTSADGVRFKVGIDCAQRADHELGHACKTARAEYERAERERITTAARAERERLRAAQLAEDVAASRARNPEHWAAAEKLQGADGFAGSFGGDMLARLQDGGDLTERQAEILANVYREHTWTPAPEGYAGTPGKRAEFIATVLREHIYETHYGLKTLYILADDAGHRFALNTSSTMLVEDEITDDQGTGRSHRPAGPGDRIRFKATPKAHEDYRGQRQTKIQRVKVLELLHSAQAPYGSMPNS